MAINIENNKKQRKISSLNFRAAIEYLSFYAGAANCIVTLINQYCMHVDKQLN